MQDHRPSFTAAFVAASRGLSPLLPPAARLVDDPLGLHLAGVVPPRVGAALRGATGPALLAARAALLPMLPWVAYMQVRTRGIDDELRSFAREGGAQVVILGAGFDARAVRLADDLPGVTFVEVDHPATQARKRAALVEAGVDSPARYLSWDFERDALSELPAALQAAGLDPERPVFVIWEGVTMYLSTGALSASLAAIAAFSPPGSRLAFNYIRRDLVESPGPLTRAVGAVVRGVGEPFRSGFDPGELGAWLGERGFRLERDDDFATLAGRWLPRRWASAVREGRRLAVAERLAVAAR